MKKFIKVVAPQPHSPSALNLCLTMDDRSTSRLKVTLSDGQEAGLFLPRGTILKEGDVLSTEDGELVTIEAAIEPKVFPIYSDDALLLARFCDLYLGNRHVPLQIDSGWCRYKFHDHVFNDLGRGLGATVRLGLEKYQPEPGAYGGPSSGHHHHHGHDDHHH
uniref:Urease accessory protein UreE n=1 Tax=Providencia rettgeri TaxID=587 RepID=A0A0K2G532_PRORE|nr:urease accessory protein UreE [Providencia rettgeri]